MTRRIFIADGHVDVDASLIREGDGVVDQLRQDLSQPGLVRLDQTRYFLFDAELDVQLFPVCPTAASAIT